MSEITAESWWGIELWIPEKGLWWSPGMRFDSCEEAVKRAAGVKCESRLVKFTLTREPFSMMEKV